jgi:hypothetical protein
MPQSLPFHSTTVGIPRVFHNNTGCAEGNAITSSHWRAGDDVRRLCDFCAQLNAAERTPQPLTSQ